MGRDIEQLDYVTHKPQQKKLATHVLQLTFTGFGGFRWPVAYFGTATANAYHIHSIFWEAIDILGQYGFTVDYCNLDGATTNRAFMKMLLPKDYQICNDFSASDVFDTSHKVVIMQDVKHVIKKIRNSIFSSKLANKYKTDISSRYILMDGKPIVWDTFEAAAKYNIKFGIRIHNKLSNESINLTPTSKMRNGLAENVLDNNMLNLVSAYRDTNEADYDLSGMINLLQHTSKLIKIFHDTRPICSMEDERVKDVHECAMFFSDWQARTLQDSTICQKQKYRHMFTEQTLSDTKSALFGFLQLCQNISDLKSSLIPNIINSDIIENLFCQQRGICHGLNSNPTLLQYGPGINSIILGQCTVSKKSNSGSKAKYFRAQIPGRLVKKQKIYNIRV